MMAVDLLETRETLTSGIEDTMGVDIDLVIDRYEIVGDIGRGAYGIVYKARDVKNNGSIVALKKVSTMEDSTDLPQHLLREVTNLKRLRSPHVIRLLDVHESNGRCQHETVWYMVFEHMEQDLDQFIQHCPSSGMHDNVIKNFLGQILRGVDAMHENRIVHRDLKPQNILVSRDARQIKIADFGLSRHIGLNAVLSTQVVTQWYRAPEVLLHSSYCESVDVWSIGCIFAEMLDRRPLFATKEAGEKSQLQQIFNVIGTPREESWPQQTQIDLSLFVVVDPQPWTVLFKKDCGCSAYDLLSKFLRFEALKRISAQDAIQHKYFSDNSSEGSSYHPEDNSH